MLDAICGYLRNWFERDILLGTFEIVDGSLVVPPDKEILNGQYIRVIGSVFSDGVWQYPHVFDHDEQFDGVVWLLGIPPQLVALAGEISDWCEANAVAINSPYQSEAFGGYSYTKSAGGSADGAGDYGWQNHFAGRLARWRKI